MILSAFVVDRRQNSREHCDWRRNINGQRSFSGATPHNLRSDFILQYHSYKRIADRAVCVQAGRSIAPLQPTCMHRSYHLYCWPTVCLSVRITSARVGTIVVPEKIRHVSPIGWQRNRAMLDTFSINVQRYSQKHAQNWIFGPPYREIKSNICALSKIFNTKNLVAEFHRKNVSFTRKTAN